MRASSDDANSLFGTDGRSRFQRWTRSTTLDRFPQGLPFLLILIGGLVLTIVVQSIRAGTDRSKRAKAVAEVKELKTALNRFYTDNGFYPNTSQGLATLFPTA